MAISWKESRAVIEGERARHLHVVLRVEPGKVFEVTDAPRLYLTPVVASTKRGGGVCARIMVVVDLPRRRDDQLNARFVDDFFRSGPRAGMHGAHGRLAPVPAWRTAPRRGSYPRRAKLPTREDPENPVWSARRKPIQPTVLLPPSPNSVVEGDLCPFQEALDAERTTCKPPPTALSVTWRVPLNRAAERRLRS